MKKHDYQLECVNTDTEVFCLKIECTGNLADVMKDMRERALEYYNASQLVTKVAIRLYEDGDLVGEIPAFDRVYVLLTVVEGNTDTESIFRYFETYADAQSEMVRRFDRMTSHECAEFSRFEIFEVTRKNPDYKLMLRVTA